MSRDHHPQLRDVTADTGNTGSSIVACWTLFTELLPGKNLIKSVTIFFGQDNEERGEEVRKVEGTGELGKEKLERENDRGSGEIAPGNLN
jgi:hypothetical protein